MGHHEGLAGLLNEAAALLVRLGPDDVAGLRRLSELLERVGSGAQLPLRAQEPVGRALWRLLDVVEGQAPDRPAALAEVGRYLEEALDQVDDARPVDAAVGAGAVDPASAAGPGEPATGAGDAAELAAGRRGPAAATADPADLAPGAPPSARAPAAAAERSDELEAELLSDFLTECAEYVAAAEAALLALEIDPVDRDAINTVFRAFHTVKGTAGFLRIGAITELAHLAESVLSRMRDGEIPCAGPYADLALRAVDMLEELLQAIGLGGTAAGPPDGYADLIAALARVAAGQSHPPSTAPVDRIAATAAAAPAPATPLDRTTLAAPAAAGAAGPGERASPPAARAGPAEPAAEGSIRVRLDRVDRLIDMVGELVIAQSMVQQDGLIGSARAEDLLRKVSHAGKIVRELQDLSLGMRMVPMRPTMQRLARVVRDVSRRTGKPCRFEAEGDETEIDRNMVEAIADPLVHMVRNAVDHGIEPSDERERLGKPPGGTVRLAAYHAGGNVVVELSDDGRGLDRARIRQQAIARGLTTADEPLTDADVLDFLFRPGFSTTDRVTDLSGRGVGMDVVRSAVDGLRGRVEVASEPGRGTTFTLRLPLTLAITDGMVVRVGAERYVVPTINIHMNLRPRADQLTTVAGRGEMVLLRDELMPLFRLDHLFGVEGAVADPAAGLLVVLDDGERRCALLVDELLGQQQVVAKSLGGYVRKVDGLAGGAILGDGQVGLILDPIDLIALARRLPSARAGGEHHLERSGVMTNGSPSSASRGSPERGAAGGKFLTFFLGEEEYGLEILKVQEIIGLLPITRVPRTPDFIRGVVNLRGKVIPVLDLRLKFGLEAVEPTTETCIVVVRADGLEVGLVVDRVSEVVGLADADVEPAPSFGADVETAYLLGVGKAEGRIKLLLDIDRVLSTQDVVDVRSAALTAEQG